MGLENPGVHLLLAARGNREKTGTSGLAEARQWALPSGGARSVPSSLRLNGWGAFYHQLLRKHNVLVMFASLGNVNVLYQKKNSRKIVPTDIF